MNSIAEVCLEIKQIKLEIDDKISWKIFITILSALCVAFMGVSTFLYSLGKENSNNYVETAKDISSIKTSITNIEGNIKELKDSIKIIIQK